MDVKTCYSHIAKDFSNTRAGVWNGVKEFLDSLSINSLVGDIGCGNGKNMLHRKNELTYQGMDFCPEFVEICKSRYLDVLEGNILNIPYLNSHFDHIICIAVIHHLEKRDARIKAIEELLRVCKSNGRILLYVWSFHQDSFSRVKFKSKDEIVPFTTTIGETFYRYYHLYEMDDLIDEVNELKIKYNFIIEKSFNERNNECIIIKKLI